MSVFKRLKSLGSTISFHTPGHAGKLNKLDSTEIPGVFPEDFVEKAQQSVANHYECKKLRFLVNGSSIGVKSMIMSVGGDIIAPKDRHQAVDEGVTLARVNLIEVENESKNGLPLPLTAKQIEIAIKNNSSAKAVLIQSPDYYGQTADLIAIREVCDKAGVKMLVDGAHGAHYATLTDGTFPLNPASIADACNLSAHKTLRAYTQSAYLAINDLSLLPAIDRNLQLLGTTSPSYVFMGQLEEAPVFERKYAYGYYARIREINKIKDKFACLKNDDPTRLVVDANALGLGGEELYKKLLGHKIVAEKYDSRYVVFIVTLSNTLNQIRKLRRVLSSYEKR